MAKKTENIFTHLPYLRAIPLAFFSRNFYREVARKWDGSGLLYVTCLLAIILLPKLWIDLHILRNYQEHHNLPANEQVMSSMHLVARIIEQFPTIVIEDGKASVDIEQPFFIHFPITGKDAVIIDTTGEITSLRGSPAFMLITESYLLLKNHQDKTKRFNFRDFNDSVINQEMLLDWIRILPWLLYPADLITQLAVIALNGVFFALIGFSIQRYHKLDFSFKQLYRLALVTATPMLIIQHGAIALSIRLFAYPEIVYTFAHIAYMYHALESNRKKVK